MEVKYMGKNKQKSSPREVKDWKAQLKDFKETLPDGGAKKSSTKT